MGIHPDYWRNNIVAVYNTETCVWIGITEQIISSSAIPGIHPVVKCCIGMGSCKSMISAGIPGGYNAFFCNLTIGVNQTKKQKGE